MESKGSRIRLRTPETEGTYTVEYGVSDSRSDPVTGLATVVVSAAAPLQAPIARDDAVPTAEALDHSSASVDVLDNDSDPDGDVDSDTVTNQDPGMRRFLMSWVVVQLLPCHSLKRRQEISQPISRPM